MMDWMSPSTVSGLGLAIFAALCVAMVLGSTMTRQRRAFTLLGVVAAGGITFQAVHFLEHGAQLGYWAARPSEPAWISPWALPAVEGLAWLCGPLWDHRPALGTEMLHLLGNIIFLAAIVAMAMLVRNAGTPIRGIWGLGALLAVQSLHVFEHVLLTGSVVVANQAVGFSTLFGQLSGEALVGYRVWFHFVFNLAGTLLAAAVLVSLHQQRLLRSPMEGEAAEPSLMPQQHRQAF
jgi:hypothetical protein